MNDDSRKPAVTADPTEADLVGDLEVTDIDKTETITGGAWQQPVNPPEPGHELNHCERVLP